MTDLDKALEGLSQDADNSEKQGAFYNLFLNTTFYLPSVKETIAPTETDAREMTLPMIVPAEGRDYFVLFDKEERLHAWAGKTVPFLTIPGHSIVDFSPSDFHWVLNPGSELNHEFVTEEIAWLKKVVAAHKAAQGGEKGKEAPCTNS